MLDFLHYIRECHAFYLTITLLVLLQYLLVGYYCFLSHVINISVFYTFIPLYTSCTVVSVQRMQLQEKSKIRQTQSTAVSVVILITNCNTKYYMIMMNWRVGQRSHLPRNHVCIHDLVLYVVQYAPMLWSPFCFRARWKKATMGTVQ